MPDELLSHLIEISYPWLCEQRDLHMADARPLSGEERQSLRDYYDSRVLDTVRLATVDRISNPPFYAELKASGNPVLDISGAVGVTFIDCIVIRRNVEPHLDTWISVLFHELVHAVQFDILGPRRHLELYLRAWAENGYQYNSIPFETQAQKLEAKFRQRGPVFSVREVVERELSDLTGQSG